MSNATEHMMLSPKSAGALFNRACRLEDENEQLWARVAELEADALRYRFLREQHWSDSSLCVVTTPKESVKPGRLCPSGELLDEAVDQAQCLRQQADEIEKAGGEQ